MTWGAIALQVIQKKEKGAHVRAKKDHPSLTAKIRGNNTHAVSTDIMIQIGIGRLTQIGAVTQIGIFTMMDVDAMVIGQS